MTDVDEILEETTDEKKAVGRPKKVKKEPVVDEKEAGRLSMSDHADESATDTVTFNSIINQYNNMVSKAVLCNLNEASQYAQGMTPLKALSAINDLNPFLQNQRLKDINTRPAEYTKEKVIEALRNPGENEEMLRSTSWEMSATQYLYYLLVRQSSDIPKYYYYKIPEYLENASDYKKKEFMEEDRLTDEWLKKFNVQTTLKQIALEVGREGKCTYMLRNSFCTDERKRKRVNYATWQKLPSNWVKLTGIGENGFIASFNMMIFMNPMYSPSQYSDYIQVVWEELINLGAVEYDEKGHKFKVKSLDILKQYKPKYKNKDYTAEIEIKSIGRGKGIKDTAYMFWVQLPQEICYTFASDMSHAWAVPSTASIYSQLQNLLDYQTLAGLVQSTPLIGVLTGEAEFINNAPAGADATMLKPDTIQAFMNLFNSMTSTNIEAFFAPLHNLKLQTLPGQTNSSEIVTNAVRDAVAQMGAAGSIITTEKPSIAQIKAANNLAAEREHSVTLQFERALNFQLKNCLGFYYDWEIVLFGDIFNIENEKKYIKELVVAGDISLLPKLHAIEKMTMRDTKAMINYINSFDIYKDFSTLTMQKSSELNVERSKAAEDDAAIGEGGTVGRPEISETDVENDSTAQSKEEGLNTSENKEQYAKENVCLICGDYMDEDDCCEGEDGKLIWICESCIEKIKGISG